MFLRIVTILEKAIDRFEKISLSGGIALLAFFLILNVVARTFYQSIYFIEEISEFLIIFITFSGVGYAAKKARHIRMGAFLDFMPPKIEKAMLFIISFVSAVVMFTMAYHSWNYLAEVKEMEQTTSALRVPYWYFLIIMPAGFFSAGIQFLLTFIKNIREKEPWLSYEKKSEYEDENIGEIQ